MKARPIPFSGAMVRAILDGRKTQTRRIVKPQECVEELSESVIAHRSCPYGQPGDRLWVKETFCVAESPDGEKCYAYRADKWTECPSENGKWMPSIFCRRVASRITLEVTGVRVERLNDITNDDALAEGIPYQPPKSWLGGGWREQAAYRDLWESINGRGSWAANPYVWVISFKRITP